MNIFAYGSLANSKVWNSVVKKEYRSERGCIKGWKLLKVKNEEYPGLVEAAGMVEGIIWFGVDKKDIERIDLFEGEEYERIKCIAEGEKGKKKYKAEVYKYKENMRCNLSDKEWNYKDFEERELSKFIEKHM